MKRIKEVILAASHPLLGRTVHSADVDVLELADGAITVQGGRAGPLRRTIYGVAEVVWAEEPPQQVARQRRR